MLVHRRQGIHNDGADMGAAVQPAGAKRAAARTDKHIRALLRPGRAAVGGFQDAGTTWTQQGANVFIGPGGGQVTPPSMVFQTPPAAAPRKATSGFRGSTA